MPAYFIYFVFVFVQSIKIKIRLDAVTRLAEESANGSLRVGRQRVEQLVGVQTRGLHEFPRGVDDALGHVALQGLGLEGLSNVGEALGSLGEDGRVGSRRVLVFRKLLRGKFERWDLLLDKLGEERVGVRCSFLIVDDRQCVDPRVDDLGYIGHLRAVEVKNLCDTSAGVLGREGIVVAAGVGALCNLEQNGQATSSEL